MEQMTYKKLVAEALQKVEELFPWDLDENLQAAGGSTSEKAPLLLDIREPDEFNTCHIEGSINVPRGILEPGCEWGYEETEPRLASAREREVVLLCRSGNRSALAGRTLQLCGFQKVKSLKTGVRGWNDSDLPLIDSKGKRVDEEVATDFLNQSVPQEKMGPKS